MFVKEIFQNSYLGEKFDFIHFDLTYSLLNFINVNKYKILF